MDGHQGSTAKQLAGLLAGLDRTFRDEFKRSNGIPHHLTLAQYQVISLIAEAGQCSQKHECQIAMAKDEKHHTNAGQRSVSDGIAGQGSLAKHGEGTDQARPGAEDAHSQEHHERVVGQKLLDHASTLPA